jgi:hypothetical protein
MDQAEPENQFVLRHQQDCGIAPDMAGDVLLFAAEFHQISGQIEWNASGAHQYDCLGAYGSPTYHY